MRRGKRIIDISLYGCGEEILEQHIKDVNPKELPKDLYHSIEVLRETASFNRVVSLAANQIEMELRMFALLKSEYITAGKWTNYENIGPQHYEIVINPKLISESNIRLKDFQECPSIPGLRFHIWNPIHQNYQYLSPKVSQNNEVKFEQKYAELKGFQARIFDHQIRHLQGILALDPQISHMQFSVNEEYQENPGMHEKLQLLRQELYLTSEKSMMKLMRQGKQNLKSQQSSLNKDLPQRATKEMRQNLMAEYKKYKNTKR